MSDSGSFVHDMKTRRSWRRFDDRAVPEEVIRGLVSAAASSPSGANRQPWHFVAIRDPEIKKRIRVEAENVEKLNYEKRFSPEMIRSLEPIGTDWTKPFLEEAPWLIVVFAVFYIEENGVRVPHYYVRESVGIACGILLSAIHLAGLATVPYTPHPARFLNRILNRPSSERPYLVYPVGYPSKEYTPPDLDRKSPDEILTVI